ncbi:outer membrane beta-barrel protein [Qipengyuania sp. 6D47A]|uniref:Outer membrane beta-barrel protein n=1 Tax=Qipengyuania qiaonensis TaxID=2867240 RepID=A0ABS7J9W8_9SPHN|nr:outer membrane beta-barrel protein [Qipengyuania qiaonensis]
MGPKLNGTFGAYAGVDFASTDYCTELFGHDEACLKAGRNITVGARVGYMIGSDALFYGKGGYSNGRVKLAYEDFDNVIDDIDEGENLDGFHVGAGAEVQLSASTYAKIEYVYSKYDAFDYSDTDVEVDLDLNRHQVLLGLGLRF